MAAINSAIYTSLTWRTCTEACRRTTGAALRSQSQVAGVGPFYAPPRRVVTGASGAGLPAGALCHGGYPGSRRTVGARNLTTRGTGGSADNQLSHVDADYRDDVARVLEQAERAVQAWAVVATDFYPPPVVANALPILNSLADTKGIAWGGYPQAERCRILVGHADVMEGGEEDPAALSDCVTLLQVRGNFMFDPASHRDFLGATLGTGMDRSKLGDVVVEGERGAAVLTTPELARFLEGALTSVRTVTVETRVAPLSELNVPPPKVQETSSVEASMRLDAIGSAGFRMSRNKMGERIKKGDVRLNWKSVTKASTEVKPGDIISVAGKGRAEVKEVTTTKKGKFSVKQVRYV